MTPAPSSEVPIPPAPSSVLPVSARTRRALAAVAGLGLVLTACFIWLIILQVQYGNGANSLPGFIALVIVWVAGLLVTIGATVWATIIALRLNRRGWAIWLVIGTLALLQLTVFALPGSLILVFAPWGPSTPLSGVPSTPRPEAGATVYFSRAATGSRE
jgi:hypothetical protein